MVLAVVSPKYAMQTHVTHRVMDIEERDPPCCTASCSYKVVFIRAVSVPSYGHLTVKRYTGGEHGIYGIFGVIIFERPHEGNTFCERNEGSVFVPKQPSTNTRNRVRITTRVRKRLELDCRDHFSFLGDRGRVHGSVLVPEQPSTNTRNRVRITTRVRKRLELDCRNCNRA